MRRKEVLIGVKSQLRAWPGFKSVGGGGGGGKGRIPALQTFENIRRRTHHSCRKIRKQGNELV